MHLLECKGVVPVTFGSVLMWLLGDARLGANKEERLERVNEHRAAFYAARPGMHILPKIYAGNVTRDQWGNLSGPAYKAACVRGAAPFFRELVGHYCRSATARDRILNAVVVAVDELYTELYAAPMFLPPDVLMRVRQLCLDFGQAYQRMRELSRRSGVYAFAVTPKTHKVQHLPLLAECINPARVQVRSKRCSNSMGIADAAGPSTLSVASVDIHFGPVVARNIRSIVMIRARGNLPVVNTCGRCC